MSDTSRTPPPDDANPPPSYPPPPPQGGYYQPGQPPAQPSDVGYAADLSNRFLARLIDYVILLVVDAILVSVIITGLLLDSTAQLFTVGANDDYGTGVITTLVSAALYLGYFTLMENKAGQTLGKMIMKLQTRGPGGGRPTFQQALRRNLFTAIGALGVIPVVGGLLGFVGWLVAVIAIAVTINNNTATRQGWHDRFAGGTYVVKIG